MSKFKKGKSGNPSGKNASNFGDMIRKHPKTLDLVQKVFDIALDNEHKNQMRAMSILMDRIAPQLKATDVKLESTGTQGVIVLPSKKRVGERLQPVNKNVKD
tara:strand:- start:1303 stop:1608 length:306 start_codon:yes stop_codon:yes gene_type:complete